ncbi:hypothetical protein BDR06DRAFT_947082 [Suillus hirtellus]|nr:hypothetical protein BDR06DRAFT_947082 [Suillus hirtellus]
MARNTLENPDEVAVKQRAQEIIQYLQNTCPTFYGSDSPVMHSTFVDVRAYSGCHGGKGPKDTRKHVYVQKRLVDNWMKGSAGTRPFYILTIFIRLCLIRGLITVVKLAFNPEKINVKPEARGSPCSLENFLSQWNGWLVFNSPGTTCVHRKALPYHELWNIVFSDRVTTFSHSGLGHSRHPYSFNFIES